MRVAGSELSEERSVGWSVDMVGWFDVNPAVTVNVNVNVNVRSRGCSVQCPLESHFCASSSRTQSDVVSLRLSNVLVSLSPGKNSPYSLIWTVNAHATLNNERKVWTVKSRNSTNSRPN